MTKGHLAIVASAVCQAMDEKKAADERKNGQI